MYRIYLDTTDRNNKSIRIVEMDGDREIMIEEAMGDLDITPELSGLLIKHKIKPKMVEKVIPNTGPGSFTGIKIGVTVANVMNWALQRTESAELYKPEYGSEPNITPRKTS